MRVKIHKLNIKKDQRGWLAEILRNDELIDRKKFGQFFITTAKPTAVKGGHYHTRKREWFCIIKGKAKLTLEDIRSKKKKVINLSEKELKTVRIDPYIIHTIKNIGQKMMYLLIYVDEAFNNKDPDTYYV